ncbi:BrnA antitoxin family protein [Aliihoeflea sp. 40Bstr573]|uniref:BrnA antitoxin family protein n=1 Tax=Aliihoeflea sp. 40Bstr573 TaxID=2696467 RepID=UPI002096162A|nr:BrnA antitoxin family protein [Aliihoeflea sp. 40Bstr573]MCO6388444.1 3-oxoacyl-ACP synthase [Aliihoeflea sp. 40Bstr573]
MKKRYDRELTLEQLAALPDDQIDTSDIPELDENFWKNAKLVEPDTTQQVTLRVKKSVLDAFKATGKGYQTRMNAVLETYVRTLHKQR